MAGSFAVVSRNKYQTFSQKLVQARVYAQGMSETDGSDPSVDDRHHARCGRGSRNGDCHDGHGRAQARGSLMARDTRQVSPKTALMTEQEGYKKQLDEQRRK